MDKVYIAIDLKSFYASAECADRKYDPLSTNLVVADLSRTENAVLPSLKKYGISGRARLFEVVQRVKEINRERFRKAVGLGVLPKDEKGRRHFTSASFDANALENDPALELSYIVAPPRMLLYENISTKVFSVYSRYVSPEDIHVYSIDEVFMDVTAYLRTYAVTPQELAMQMIREVLYETGITATAGIGTNMYLAKVAMDIVAKHVPADEQGVRIAELDDGTHPVITFTVFEPDEKKQGGRYVEITDSVKRIDTANRKVVLMSARESGINNSIDFDSIVAVHGELVDYIDESFE